jgi:tetratricopeptide (TPR) repeat protein
MLEMVREYALEKLREASEEAVVRQRHLAHCLDLAHDAVRDLGSTDAEASALLLESEVANFRAALAWAQQTQDSANYLDLCATLWPFWEVRGYLTEGRAHLRIALSLPKATDPPVSLHRARALLGAAMLAICQHDLKEAFTCGEESLERFRAAEDTRGVTEALLCLGLAHLTRFDFVRAGSLLTEGLERSRQAAWNAGGAFAALHLGRAAMYQHDTRLARSFLEEGLAVFEALGDRRMVATVNHNLAYMAIEEGDYVRARELLEQNLEIHQRLGDRLGTARTIGDLANVEQQRDWARALGYCQQEATLWRELGNPAGVVSALDRIGSIQYRRGQYEPARQAYAEALALLTTLLGGEGFEHVRMNLGCALFHLGDAAGAEELHRESLALYARTDNQEGMVWSLERLGGVAARQGDARKAARLLGAASALREGLGRPLAPWDKRDLDNALDETRAPMTEAAFAEEFALGRAMAVEQATQATQWALSEASAASAASAPIDAA